MRIRLTGHGEVGPGGGPAGDLYVEVHERPHDVFTRDGEDLHCRVTLPMTAAALGTTLSLQDAGRRGGPRHPARHPVRQRAHAARARRAPAAGHRPRATCWCTSRCTTPTRLDAEQEKLLRELAALRGEDQPGSQPRGAGRAVLPGARRLQRALTRDDAAPTPGARTAPRCSCSTTCPRPAELLVDGAEGRHAVDVLRLTAGRAGPGRRRAGHGRRGRGRRRPGPTGCGSRSRARLRGARRRSRSSCWSRRCPRATAARWPWSWPPSSASTGSCRGRASRCVTRWRDDRVDKGVAKWRAAARAASKQSRRPRVPEVTEPMTHPRGVRAARRHRPRAWCCTSRPAGRSPALDVPADRHRRRRRRPRGRAHRRRGRRLPRRRRARRSGSGAEVLRTSTAGAAALAALSSAPAGAEPVPRPPHGGGGSGAARRGRASGDGSTVALGSRA